MAILSSTISAWEPFEASLLEWRRLCKRMEFLDSSQGIDADSDRTHLGEVLWGIEIKDVAATLRSARDHFDAILLDVDNGPTAFTVSGNTALYSDTGIATAFAALKPNGVLAVWSAREDKPFERRLRHANFTVKTEHASANSKSKGSRHTIHLAHKSRPAR